MDESDVVTVAGLSSSCVIMFSEFQKKSLSRCGESAEEASGSWTDENNKFYPAKMVHSKISKSYSLQLVVAVRWRQM